MHWLFIVVIAAVAAQSSSGLSYAADDLADGLFSNPQVLELTLKAPFDDLFTNARDDADYAVKGSIELMDTATGQRVTIGNLDFSTRGHTSRNTTECDFPKLKVKLPSGTANAALFTGVKTVKIGTHCGDRADGQLTPKFGRVANEKAPHREALVYQLLDAAQVPTLRARPARISYVFTGADGADKVPVVRNAMLLEGDDAAVERLGGTTQLPEDQFESAKTVFAPADTARLAFAEAMIGNFDWCLRFFPGDTYRCDDRHPLWNVVAIVRRDGSAVPAIYDFDLSGIVVGRHNWFKDVLNEAFLPSGSQAEVEVLSQLQRTRSLFGREELDAARAAFARNKTAIYRALTESIVDEEGRRQAAAFVDSFFAIVEDDKRFYLPVVAVSDTRVYLDAARTRPACGDASVARVGTPVSPPLAVSGDMSRVMLLDALWRWAPPRRCNAVRNAPVWIATRSVDTHYPR
jgi:hypothetical protein